MNESQFRAELKARKLGCRKLGEGNYQISSPWMNYHSFQLGPEGWVILHGLSFVASTVEQEVRDIIAAAEASNLTVVQALD
jgi:hypothetical protein